jgi:hypothetical protein
MMSSNRRGGALRNPDQLRTRLGSLFAVGRQDTSCQIKFQLMHINCLPLAWPMSPASAAKQTEPQQSLAGAFSFGDRNVCRYGADLTLSHVFICTA